MNCKAGDLAVIVRSSAGNEGKIVRCIRLVTECAQCRWPDGTNTTEAVWEVDTELIGCSGGTGPFCQDSILRPIRDPGDDAVDEMLLRVGLPEGEMV